MLTRRLSHTTVQSMLKALRSAKLNVTGDSRKGYEVHAGDQLVFMALPGKTDYLVRLEADLFV